MDTVEIQERLQAIRDAEEKEGDHQKAACLRSKLRVDFIKFVGAQASNRFRMLADLVLLSEHIEVKYHD